MNDLEILRAQLKVLAEIDKEAEGEPEHFFEAWMEVREALIRKLRALTKEKQNEQPS